MPAFGSSRWVGAPTMSMAEAFPRLRAAAHATVVAVVMRVPEPVLRAWDVAEQAWRDDRATRAHRRPMGPEVEFLPAALEIIESPPSPVGRALAWLLIAVALSALAWSIVGKVDVVAIAQGKVVPAGRTKIIQPGEVGVVHAIHVEDGHAVKVGDVLIELDTTTSGADRRRLGEDLAAARIEVARYAALVALDDSLAAFEPPPGAPDDLVRRHRRLLASEVEERRARLAALEGEIAKLEADQAATAVQVEKLVRTVPLLRERVDARRTLAAEGHGPRLQALEMSQQLVEHEHELTTQRHRLVQAKAALVAAHRNREQVAAEFRRDSLAHHEEAARRVAELTQELIKAEQRHSLQTLTAPVAGVVQQLAVHTIGGVVTAAQPLMAIVPGDGGVEVEAQVENRDIGFVRPGQEAEIKFDAFLYTRYGTVPGRIASVSRDAIADEKKGLIYSARIRLDRSTIAVDGQDTPLGAGLAATVEIKTDRRRIIEYLLSPLKRYRHEALRER